MKRADQSAVAMHVLHNVPEATAEQISAVVDARVNWRYRMKRAGEYVERGWSSEHTATGFVRHPIPRIYELDVVRDTVTGCTGTVVHREGAFLMLEDGSSASFDGAFFDVRVDEVELVWTR